MKVVVLFRGVRTRAQRNATTANDVPVVKVREMDLENEIGHLPFTDIGEAIRKFKENRSIRIRHFYIYNMPYISICKVDE